MKTRPEQLKMQLEKSLAPLYLITGDEPLLIQEAQDAIRSSARSKGYEERIVLDVETGFDWNRLLNETKNLSLFHTQRIIELRLSSGKLGEHGAKALQEYCTHPPQDTLLIIAMGKLDSSSQNSAWFKSVDKIGVIVQIWPIDLPQMPRWILDRLHQAGLETTQEGVNILVAHSEGNLLAAVQEVEKLKLLHGQGALTSEQIKSAITDNARFDVYALADACLQGDGKRAVRILQTLKQEDAEPTLILWALAREVRTLLQLTLILQQNKTLEDAMQSQRIWEKRKPLFRKCVSRYPLQQWKQLLQRAAKVDRVMKGIMQGDVWDELLVLCLAFSGIKI